MSESAILIGEKMISFAPSRPVCVIRDCPDSISSRPKCQQIRLSKAIQILVYLSHGHLLRLLAGFAIEQPLRRQSRDGRAHFDTHEA